LAAVVVDLGVTVAAKLPDAMGVGETAQATLGLGGVVGGGTAFSFSSSELKDNAKMSSAGAFLKLINSQ